MTEHNDLLAAVAAYVVADKGGRELAKAEVERILAGLGDSPVRKAETKDAAIKRILLELGVPNSIKGHALLVCAIRMVAEDPSIAEQITKELYPEVAKRFGDIPSRAERAIRHAIEVSFDRCDSRVIERYFGNTVSPKKDKPTNSEFITRLADVVRNGM